MLLYVLPFVILLVVAIILKKREANKNAEPSKKPTAVKTKAKPVNHSELEIIEPVLADPTREKLVAYPRTELAPELRRHIENQMRDGNYFAAEAQINQALNRDNGQHELYLMLLDLHLLQNDEFAINQLFTHLRSLQLDDILKQAQDKREAYEQKIVAEAKAKADAQLAVSSLSFEQLQEQVTPKTQTPLELKTSEVKTTNEEKPVSLKLENPAPEAAKPLNTSFATRHAVTTEVKRAEPDTVPTVQTDVAKEPQPLEFSFNLEPAKTTEQIAVTETRIDEQSTQARGLDFNFTPTETTKTTAQAELKIDSSTNSDKKEFDFNFSSPVETAKPKAELEFNLEQPAVEKAHDEFHFDTQVTPAPVKTQNFEVKIEQPQVEPVIQIEPPVAKIVPPVEAIKDHDPLLQLFPALGQINEADINLRLASEYIRLGAYTDAKALLAEQEHSYNDQQRQIAMALRNKIA
jgi:hypothetical protein